MVTINRLINAICCSVPKAGLHKQKALIRIRSSGKVCYHARQVRQKGIEVEKTGS